MPDAAGAHRTAVNITYFDPADADNAFAVHAALSKAEAADPALASNEQWREQRDIAFARFNAAFSAGS